MNDRHGKLLKRGDSVKVNFENSSTQRDAIFLGESDAIKGNAFVKILNTTRKVFTSTSLRNVEKV